MVFNLFANTSTQIIFSEDKIDIIKKEIVEKLRANNSTKYKLNLIQYCFRTYGDYCDIMSILLHTLSGVTTNDQDLSIEIINYNLHHHMFYVARTSKQKWLLYSVLWNIFRFPICRDKVSKKFMNKILKQELFPQCEKLKNTYIGCLSNLSINDKFKKLIFNKLIKSKEINLNMDRETLISFNGLLTNLSVDTEIGEKLLNSRIYMYNLIKIKELFKTHMEDSLMRNVLAFLNNICDIEHSIKYLIEIDFYEIMINLIKNNDIEEEYIHFIKRIFDVEGDIDETTSLHLASKYNYKDLVLKKIKNNCDINKKDKLGNTILHNSLITGDYGLARFYILLNANVDAKNCSNYTPRDISNSFVSSVLKSKNKIDNSYKVEIQSTFEENCDLFEKGHIDTVFSFINTYDKMYTSTN